MTQAGSYLARHTHDAQLLAVAVNQPNICCNRLVFIAIRSGVATVADMHGMGTCFPAASNPWSVVLKFLCLSLRYCISWLSGRVHGSLSAVTHAPFHASMPRPASQAGPMPESAGVEKLVNAALLSLINEACVWMYVALPSARVNSSAPLVCRHNRVTREAGRLCLMGRDHGRRGYWVTLYLFIYTNRKGIQPVKRLSVDLLLELFTSRNLCHHHHLQRSVYAVNWNCNWNSK